jgi:hypothetical protein
MTDIGDDVTIPIVVRVAGVLTDPASVSVAVTPPTGAVQNQTPTRLSTGVYEAVVNATLADRWLYTVTTTDPASVEHGHFDVAVSPPRLAPLATVADLEDRVGTLTDAQRARADALLRDASAKIRSYTKQTFDRVLNDVIVLRPVGAHLRLPQRPVTAVDQVVALGGTVSDLTLPLGSWQWDGIDLVELWPLSTETFLGLPESWGEGFGPDTYRVTYDHGYAVTPEDVVSVACSMVGRSLLSPSMVEGLRSETIGSYSYSLGGDGSVGATVRMSDDDRNELKDYRRTQSTIALKVR